MWKFHSKNGSRDGAMRNFQLGSFWTFESRITTTIQQNIFGTKRDCWQIVRETARNSRVHARKRIWNIKDNYLRTNILLNGLLTYQVIFSTYLGTYLYFYYCLYFVSLFMEGLGNSFVQLYHILELGLDWYRDLCFPVQSI